jgi:hypothetical protein
MPRVLVMHEHRVDDGARAGYVALLQARREQAKSMQVNFWVFEHGVEHGRFVEFLEAADEMALDAVHASHTPGALWHEVENT